MNEQNVSDWMGDVYENCVKGKGCWKNRKKFVMELS